jgi:hypothetical protein
MVSRLHQIANAKLWLILTPAQIESNPGAGTLPGLVWVPNIFNESPARFAI